MKGVWWCKQLSFGIPSGYTYILHHFASFCYSISTVEVTPSFRGCPQSPQSPQSCPEVHVCILYAGLAKSVPWSRIPSVPLGCTWMHTEICRFVKGLQHTSTYYSYLQILQLHNSYYNIYNHFTTLYCWNATFDDVLWGLQSLIWTRCCLTRGRQMEDETAWTDIHLLNCCLTRCDTLRHVATRCEPRWSPSHLERSLYEAQHHDQDPSDILNIQDEHKRAPTS